MATRKAKKAPAPAPKAAPAPASPEQVEAAPNRYRVKPGAPPVWTGRELATAGQEVTLLPGEEPSKWLEPIA